MTSRKTEIQVGLTVLVAIAVLLSGIAWLSAVARSHLQRVWHVSFAQAGGLAEGDEAHVNGVRKGVVRALRLSGDHVVVDLALARDVQLTHDSRVVIRSTSLLGDKAIAVDYRGSGAPWSERDTIPGVFEKGLPEVMADLGSASGGLSGIAQQLDSLAQALNRDGGLAATVGSFRRTSAELEAAVAENRVALRRTMEQLSGSAGAVHRLVAEREPELGSALDHFGSAAANLDRLSGRLDSLRASLQGTAARLERGDGTLGRLVQDERLYDDLSASVRELRALIADIQAHPRKYIKLSVF